MCREKKDRSDKQRVTGSLSVEDQWQLIDELWSDLAQEVERAGPDDNIVSLLDERYADYLEK
jgi:hypothetical protein